jgi:sec-independent protein translocase protein TatA
MWKPGLPELIAVLVIVMLIFGPGKITQWARDLGSSIRSFREGLGQKDEEQQDKQDPPKTE